MAWAPSPSCPHRACSPPVLAVATALAVPPAAAAPAAATWQLLLVLSRPFETAELKVCVQARHKVRSARCRGHLRQTRLTRRRTRRTCCDTEQISCAGRLQFLVWQLVPGELWACGRVASAFHPPGVVRRRGTRRACSAPPASSHDASRYSAFSGAWGPKAPGFWRSLKGRSLHVSQPQAGHRVAGQTPAEAGPALGAALSAPAARASRGMPPRSVRPPVRQP